jgi:uncharacterized protein
VAKKVLEGKHDYIETFTGLHFYLSNPEFEIKDICHALAMQCRYTGHCERRYSVAEHSCLVSYIMEDLKLGDPFEGLMHDAQEAYLTDIAKPWKKFLPDYNKIEKDLEAKLRYHFGIPGITTSPGCKIADSLALILEARVLIKSEARDWDLSWCPEAMKLANTPDIANNYIIKCDDVESAKREFMGRYRRLRAQNAFT